MESVHFYLSKQGVYGDLFFPAVPVDREKVMIVIGGSDNSYDLSKATASGFASYGLCTFSLACWGVKGLPQFPDRIPLEMIAKTRSILEKKGFTSIGGYGIGRGADMLLAAESLRHSLDFIIAVSASGNVLEGDYLADLGSRHSTFTYGNEELPFLRKKNAFANILRKSMVYVKKPDPSFFENTYEAAKEDARIKVEDIHVPLLLLTSDEDPIWSGTASAKRMMEKLNETGHKESYRHIVFEKGQHLLFPEAYGLERSLIKHAKGYAQAVARTQRASVKTVMQFVRSA